MKWVEVQGNLGGVGGPSEEERLRVADSQQKQSGKIQRVNQRGMWFHGGQHASESEDTRRGGGEAVVEKETGIGELDRPQRRRESDGHGAV